MARVLHIVPRLGVPSQAFIATLLQNLSADESCAVLTMEVIDDSGFDDIPVFEIRSAMQKITNALVRRIAPGKSNLWVERPYFLSTRFRAIQAETACRILHCHFGQALFFLARVSGGRCELPVIASFHGTDTSLLPMRAKGYQHAIQAFLDQNQVTITVPSAYLKGQFLQQFTMDEKQVQVVPNGYSAEFTSDRSALAAATGSSFRVVCIGRFVPWKGHRYLLEGFANFCRTRPDAELILVGTSEGGVDIAAMLDEFGIAERTTLLQDIPHERVAVILASASAYVQPSIVDPRTGQCESFGVAALEALVSGTPTIITKTGGMVELVEEQFFPHLQAIDPANASQISAALTNLDSAEQPLRNPAMARYFQARYAPANSFDQIRRLYEATEAPAPACA